MEMESRKRGSGRKKAPPGYYTAKEAQNKLGMQPSTFRYYILRGKIKRHVPPMKVEGYYKKEEIDRLAVEMALVLHDTSPATETRVAVRDDAQGVVDVLEIMGWKTASADQRISWYEVNPCIDYVAIVDGKIGGYIHAAPLVPETLKAMMQGKKRSWDVVPSDFYRYEPGGVYDLYIGIATRKDIEHHTQRIGFRLISGFFTFLEELADQGITIRKLYAVSDQPDGQRLCRNIGFVQLPVEEGDKFPRFALDLETSSSHFAKLYRDAIKQSQTL